MYIGPFVSAAVIRLFENPPMFYLMGRVDGWDGLDGLDGLDGEQKCPLMFFIFCGYIDKVYTYLYR